MENKLIINKKINLNKNDIKNIMTLNLEWVDEIWDKNISDEEHDTILKLMYEMKKSKIFQNYNLTMSDIQGSFNDKIGKIIKSNPEFYENEFENVEFRIVINVKYVWDRCMNYTHGVEQKKVDNPLIWEDLEKLQKTNRKPKLI
ncbi:MAG: hypothetical protein ACOC22_00495 [bacterium]